MEGRGGNVFHMEQLTHCGPHQGSELCGPVRSNRIRHPKTGYPAMEKGRGTRGGRDGRQWQRLRLSCSTVHDSEKVGETLRQR